MSDQIKASGYASDAEVAKYFGIHIKSLLRWDRRPGLGFPSPIRVNGRKYREWAAIHEFERRAAAAHVSKSHSTA